MIRISPVPRKLRAGIPALRRHLRQRRRDIQFRDRGGRGANPLGFPGRLLADFRKKMRFSILEIFSSAIQHLALVFLEFRRSEALGVHQRLLAFVIGRRQVPVGIRDLDVIPEHIVEPDFERGRCRSACVPGSRSARCTACRSGSGRGVRPVPRRNPRGWSSPSPTAAGGFSAKKPR